MRRPNPNLPPDRGNAEEGTQTKCEYCGEAIHTDLAADLGWQVCQDCGADVCPDCAGAMPNGLCHICARAKEEESAN